MATYKVAGIGEHRKFFDENSYQDTINYICNPQKAAFVGGCNVTSADTAAMEMQKTAVAFGKDKGKSGKVVSVDKKNGTVVVEGINKVFKHSKPSMANQQGGIIEMEAPLDISNVMYLYKGKPVRVGFEGTGKDKVRVAKVDGKTEKID